MYKTYVFWLSTDGWTSILIILIYHSLLIIYIIIDIYMNMKLCSITLSVEEIQENYTDKNLKGGIMDVKECYII